MTDSAPGRAGAAVDGDELVEHAQALVRVPSVTGDERLALERLCELAAAAGLEAELHEHDLERVAALPGYPGAVAARDALHSASITLRGRRTAGRRFLLNGHLDVVPPGSLPWQHDPFGGELRDGRLHGRGSLDMKGAVAAALQAMLAFRRAHGAPAHDVVLQAVASEEDGGQGAFAALEGDADFAGCLIPEPTSFAVVCAHAGSIQLEGVVRGVSTHAATRLAGVSALDEYVHLHRAFADLEARLNDDVQHPLMRDLELPYPVVVGRIEGGRWVSQVPDEVRFAARVGVPVGSTLDETWRQLVEALEAAPRQRAEPLELRRLGAFRPSAVDLDAPLVAQARRAVEAECGEAPVAGVPWGADMQHVLAKGIPCVMVGTAAIERAHAVDEWVDVEELERLARVIARLLVLHDRGP